MKKGGLCTKKIWKRAFTIEVVIFFTFVTLMFYVCFSGVVNGEILFFRKTLSQIFISPKIEVFKGKNSEVRYLWFYLQSLSNININEIHESCNFL